MKSALVTPIVAASCVLLGASQIGLQAANFGGVEFPQGALSFADQVVSYTPGSGVLAPNNDPSQALGVPNYDVQADLNYVSLGDVPGSLVLRFLDNSLTTSGTPADDLWVFEIGGAIEPTSVDISTDGINWLPIGDTGGATSGIDLDSIAGVIPGAKYSYVRLSELPPLQSGSPFAGADIDAVGAISSTTPVGTPDSGGPLLLLPLFGLLALRRHLK